MHGPAKFAALSAGQAAAVGHVAALDLLPDDVRDLVLDDQQRRNDICWGVFSC